MGGQGKWEILVWMSQIGLEASNKLPWLWLLLIMNTQWRILLPCHSAVKVLVALWYLCLACSFKLLSYIPESFLCFRGSASMPWWTEGFQNPHPIWKPTVAVSIFIGANVLPPLQLGLKAESGVSGYILRHPFKMLKTCFFCFFFLRSLLSSKLAEGYYERCIFTTFWSP